jgi:hypothetical protein
MQANGNIHTLAFYTTVSRYTVVNVCILPSAHIQYGACVFVTLAP